MSRSDELFFTTIGCMDGRVQKPVFEYGKVQFIAEYPDTITEAGLVGLLAKDTINLDLLDSLKRKILISLTKHNSKGIIVHGHSECAGNPVDDQVHKEHVRKSVKKISEITESAVPVVGVFIKRGEEGWEVERVE